jgi:hypothetical protein
MHFGSPHYYSILILVNNPHVIVLMLYLLRGVKAPISFHICLGSGNTQIIFL